MTKNALFSPEDKAKCVLLMAEHGGSAAKARKLFYRQNGRKFAPKRTSIKRWYEQFKSTGFVTSLGKTGRKSLGPAIVEEVANLFAKEPSITIRQAVQRLELPVSRATVQRIIRKKLKLYPYKIQLVHKLQPGDYDRRVSFAQTVLARLEDDPSYLDKILFTDEATFHVSGLVHRYNVEGVTQNGTKICLAKFTSSLSVGRILTFCFRLLVNEAHIFLFN